METEKAESVRILTLTARPLVACIPQQSMVLMGFVQKEDKQWYCAWTQADMRHLLGRTSEDILKFHQKHVLLQACTCEHDFHWCLPEDKEYVEKLSAMTAITLIEMSKLGLGLDG